jgi:hypothetical protein
MDPDIVMALGSLIHDLLGLIGGIILCYFGYRLMMRRIKAFPPTDGEWNWKAAKTVFKNTAPGTLFALLGAVAIWLTAAKGLRSDGPSSLSTASNANNPAQPKTSDDAPIVMSLGAGIPWLVRESQNSISGSHADSAAVSASAGTSGIVDSRSSTASQKPEGISDATGGNAKRTKQQPDAKINVSRKIVHRNLERQRLAAERKRSRLESMYQKGTISMEAYKSGEDEYRIAIQRYRSQVTAARLDEN